MQSYQCGYPGLLCGIWTTGSDVTSLSPVSHQLCQLGLWLDKLFLYSLVSHPTSTSTMEMSNAPLSYVMLLWTLYRRGTSDLFLIDVQVRWDIRILPPCKYCHHPWCVGDKSDHKALIVMFSCDGISDHASWNEVFHYWDTKFSCTREYQIRNENHKWLQNDI